MIARLSMLLLGSSPLVLAAQSFEATGGIARFAESFTTDCCGPTRAASGSSFSVRVQRGSRTAAFALEGGATFAGGRGMKWLMPVFALTLPKRPSPWFAVGAGLMAQPGECPADASDTSPDCTTHFVPGWLVGAGIRPSLSDHVAISLETSLVRGLVGARRFTTQRMGLGIRVH